MCLVFTVRDGPDRHVLQADARRRRPEGPLVGTEDRHPRYPFPISLPLQIASLPRSVRPLRLNYAIAKHAFLVFGALARTSSMPGVVCMS